jgi:hypothetical protein
MSDWTVDTLKEHIDQRFDDNKLALDAALASADRATSAALASSKEAIVKSEAAAEKRFESVNEFRKTLTDQTASFMPRSEVETRMSALSEKVSGITDRLNTSAGQQEGSKLTKSNIYAAIGIVGTLSGVLTFVIANIIK